MARFFILIIVWNFTTASARSEINMNQFQRALDGGWESQNEIFLSLQEIGANEGVLLNWAHLGVLSGNPKSNYQTAQILRSSNLTEYSGQNFDFYKTQAISLYELNSADSRIAYDYSILLQRGDVTGVRLVSLGSGLCVTGVRLALLHFCLPRNVNLTRDGSNGETWETELH